MAAERHPLSAQPGTYALIVSMPQPTTITVGRLGRFRFPAGTYIYVGSARGPGGLRARIKRHLRHPKPHHWHIDYVRAHAQPTAVWTIEGDQKQECAWAEAATQLPGARRPVAGFGASDCRCPTHLIHLPKLPDRAAFEQLIGAPIHEVNLNERSSENAAGGDRR